MKHYSDKTIPITDIEVKEIMIKNIGFMGAELLFASCCFVMFNVKSQSKEKYQMMRMTIFFFSWIYFNQSYCIKIAHKELLVIVIMYIVLHLLNNTNEIVGYSGNYTIKGIFLNFYFYSFFDYSMAKDNNSNR